MFGTLRPHRCTLSPDTRLAHRRLYCGLCKTLGDDYGQLSRALVSHDAVLMGTIVEALAREAPAPASCRCPLNPLVHRPTFATDSVPMQFAAATQVLLADQWLADRAADGRLAARVLRPVGRAVVQQASATLSGLGAEPHRLAGFEVQQQVVESAASPSPRQAAQPTAHALATAFSWVASAPGTIPLSPPAQQALASLGGAVGETIYGIDALEDLESDLREGSFNPCIRDGRVDAAAVEACAEMVMAAQQTLRRSLDAVPWQRERELLDSVLIRQQGRRAQAAIARARSLVGVGVPSPLERLLAALTALWLWLVAIPRGGRLRPRASQLPGEVPKPEDEEAVPEEGAEEEKGPDGRKRRRKRSTGDNGGSMGQPCCVDCCCEVTTCGSGGTSRGCGCCEMSLPGPCKLDACPCDGDGCGCQPDCCCCDGG